MHKDLSSDALMVHCQVSLPVGNAAQLFTALQLPAQQAYGKPPATMPFVNEINYPQGQPLFQGLFDSLCRVLFHRSIILLLRYRVCVHIRLLQGYTC